jgi:hypothetical protein
MTATNMLWEEGFDSWQAVGVTSQPTAILFDSSGTAVAKWGGFFDAAPVLAALDGVAMAEAQPDGSGQ